jgi:hypothetical protein
MASEKGDEALYFTLEPYLSESASTLLPGKAQEPPIPGHFLNHRIILKVIGVKHFSTWAVLLSR